MRFYRLEKQNIWTFWGSAILKSIGIALVVTIITALIMGYKFMIVSSGSMEPTLPVGSMVIVTPCDYEDLELGDIVTMNKAGTNLTHRVAGKKDINNKTLANPGEEGYDEESYSKGIWFTRGEYQGAQDDAKVDSNEVVGKVYEAHCFTIVGEIVMYVKGNYKLLIIFLVILAVFMWIMKWMKDKLAEDDVECYESEEE